MTGGRRARALLVVAVVLPLVGFLGACTRAVEGTGTPPAKPPRASELLQQAVTTMDGLDTGFAVTLSTDTGTDTARTDLRFQGDDASGTLTRKDEQADARRVDGRTYIRGSEAYWRSYDLAAADAVSLDGAWTEVPADDGRADQLRKSTYLDAFGDDADSQYASVESRNDGGTRVWVLTGADTEVDISLTVTADGPPRLLRYTSPVGEIEFSYPTDDLDVSAPDDVVPYPR